MGRTVARLSTVRSVALRPRFGPIAEGRVITPTPTSVVSLPPPIFRLPHRQPTVVSHRSPLPRCSHHRRRRRRRPPSPFISHRLAPSPSLAVLSPPPSPRPRPHSPSLAVVSSPHPYVSVPNGLLHNDLLFDHVSKMRKLSSSLDSLREELSGISETEQEMTEVLKHVNELERILRETKRVKVTFSNATNLELQNLDVKAGRLVFKASKVADLAKEGKWGNHVDEELKDLSSRLHKIHHRVNMNYEVGARMLLDAILLSLGEVISTLNPNHDLAIIPEMKPQDAAFENGNYRVLFGGSIDYGVVEYEKDPDNDNEGRLVGPDSTNAFVLRVAAGQIFLVEAKRLLISGGLGAFVPEAVTQAMAISSNAKLNVVRFCLSDGFRFIFFVLKTEDDRYTYYQSTARELGRPMDLTFNERLREIVYLLVEWLKPEQTELYELKD
ncbi:unnamed protein product [Cyclocybe aegerita]|uniref:Uncharacterized protein n=1 Tax=Cyclocybe aegerita TaxID=1973307 RepID=A0A8S0VVE3_CYCAE|nr:unnamed protein product [Cyclocybe aegerita]